MISFEKLSWYNSFKKMMLRFRHLMVASLESNTTTRTADVDLGTRHEHLPSRLLTTSQ
jgi:hypothetical protein